MMASRAGRVAPNDEGGTVNDGNVNEAQRRTGASTAGGAAGTAGYFATTSAFGAVVPGRGECGGGGGGGDSGGGSGSLEPYAYDPTLLRRATTEGRKYLVDALRFLFFLALFTFTSMASENNQDLYWLGGQVSEFFEKSELLQRDESFPKTLLDVRTEHEVWKYISGVFYPALYGSTTWDNDAAFKKTSSKTSSQSADSDSSSFAADWRTYHNNRQGWVMGGARMVGGARIGTVR